MPRVPDISLPSVQLAPMNMPEMQAGGVAPMPNAMPGQIQQLGQAVGKIGEGAASIAMRLQDVLNDSVVAQVDNELRTALQQSAINFQSKQGRDAIEGYKPYQDEVSKMRQDYEKRLTNDAQRLAFRRVADRRISDLQKQTDWHVVRETQAFQLKESGARLNGMLEETMTFGATAYGIQDQDPGFVGPPSVMDVAAKKAKQDALDAYQTRYNALINLGKEHLKLQGIGLDDAQGKVFMDNLNKSIHTNIFNSLVESKNYVGARNMLANRDARKMIDQDELAKADALMTKKEREGVALRIARAIQDNPNFTNVESRREAARMAFDEGLLSQDEVDASVKYLDQFDKEDRETKADLAVRTFEAAQSFVREQTGGRGIIGDPRTWLLNQDPNIYKTLVQTGKLEPLVKWMESDYQLKSNINDLMEIETLKQQQPALLMDMSPTEMGAKWTLSKSDLESLIAWKAKESGSSNAKQRGIIDNDEMLLAQYISEERSKGKTISGKLTEKDSVAYLEWKVARQEEFDLANSDPSNPKDLKTFLQERNEKIYVDGTQKFLRDVAENEEASWRVFDQETNDERFVRLDDVPQADLGRAVESIRALNDVPYAVGTIVTDESGRQVFKQHYNNGRVVRFQNDFEASQAVQALGGNFVVRKMPAIPETTQEKINAAFLLAKKDAQTQGRQLGLEYFDRISKTEQVQRTFGSTGFEGIAQKYLGSEAPPQGFDAQEFRKDTGIALVDKNKGAELLSNGEVVIQRRNFGAPIQRKSMADFGITPEQLDSFFKTGIPDTEANKELIAAIGWQKPYANPMNWRESSLVQEPKAWPQDVYSVLQNMATELGTSIPQAVQDAYQSKISPPEIGRSFEKQDSELLKRIAENEAIYPNGSVERQLATMAGFDRMKSIPDQTAGAQIQSVKALNTAKMRQEFDAFMKNTLDLDKYESSRFTTTMNQIMSMVQAGSEEAAAIANKAMTGQIGLSEMESFLQSHDASFKKVDALKQFTKRNNK